MKVSEWYPILEKLTPKSWFFDSADPYLEVKLDKFIQEKGFPFARMDSYSPKWFKPFRSGDEIIKKMKTHHRTKDYFGQEDLILRTFVDLSEFLELRCFICNGKLTAISQNDVQSDSEPVEDPIIIKKESIKFIDLFIEKLPKDCTVDIAIHPISLDKIVIEVNSSFKEKAGTGLFDEDSPEDLRILENGPVIFRYHPDIFMTKEEC